MEKLKKFDFHISFNVATDIVDQGQNINIGSFRIDISEKDAMELINKSYKEDLISANKAVYRHYVLQKQIAYRENNEEPIKQKPERGSLYLVRSGDFCKIGISQDIDNRLRSLKTSCPNGIELILHAEVDNYKDHETYLHGFFKESRVNGEWFSLSEDKIDIIKEYVSEVVYLENYTD